MGLIILVRHGETDWNKEKIFRGRTDIPLNENGLLQARRTGEALKGLPVEAVFSSPLSRALMTAREIAAAFDLTVQPASEFTDLDFGLWEGMQVKEVADKYPCELKRWQETPQLGAGPGGETLAAVRERAWAGLTRLAGGRAGGTMVVVSHRVVLKILLLAVLGLDESKFWMLQQDPCAINVVRYSGGLYFLHRFNETCHLKKMAEAISQTDF